MSSNFNEYGAVDPRSLLGEFGRSLSQQVKEFLGEGHDPIEIRAIGQYLETCVSGVVCEAVLSKAMKIRKAERHEQ